MPTEMTLAAGISPRLVARRAARRVYYGHPAWRLVPGVLLGADGGAVRARGDEPDLDARGFRADRSREVAAVAHGGDGRRICGAACGGDGCGGGPSERSLVDRTDEWTYVMAEVRRQTNTLGDYYVSADSSRDEVNQAWGIDVLVSTAFTPTLAVLLD